MNQKENNMTIEVKNKFIELRTFLDNNRILMRLDHISSCSELQIPGTKVGLFNGETIHVRESYEDIRSILKERV